MYNTQKPSKYLIIIGRVLSLFNKSKSKSKRNKQANKEKMKKERTH